MGTVVEVYDDSDRHLIGKRVGVNSFITCGRCDYCRNGLENLCRQTKHLGHGQGWGKMDFYPGGMAEFCPSFASQVYELTDRVTDDQATFFDPIIAAMHAVDVAGPKMLDAVAIQGAGPIGLLIVELMKLQGARMVTISDIAESNLDIAKKIGADCIVNVADGKSTLLDAAMCATGGRGVRKVFNTVGTQESIVESLKMLSAGGVVVLMATKDPEISIPSLSISGERAIRTSSNAMLSDFPRAVALMEAGMLDVDSLITHRFPLSRATEAFDVACNKDRSNAVKIVLDCRS
jgi:2-desacetyl-2-hydroxyethyl bacteriochlorophyllide A dehydrogenase